MNWFQVVTAIIVVVVTVLGFIVLNDYLGYRSLQKRLKKERERKEK